MPIKKDALTLALALIRREAADIRLQEVRAYNLDDHRRGTRPELPCRPDDLDAIATLLDDIGRHDIMGALALRDAYLHVVKPVTVDSQLPEPLPRLFEFLDFILRHGDPRDWSHETRKGIVEKTPLLTPLFKPFLELDRFSDPRHR